MTDSESINPVQNGTLELNSSQPLASISLDLDNQWSYMKTWGQPGWESFPSYFDIFIPHILDILDRWNLKITFFVVGKDVALEKNHHILKLLIESGHEIGNHSFHHDVWLRQYTKEDLKKDIMDTDLQIQKVFDHKPIGFRGPGFMWSQDLLEILADNGYQYDSSTFPSYIGPLANKYFSRSTNLSDDVMEKREGLYGSLRDGLRPIKPYYWQLNSKRQLLEIPVTTMPGIRSPFHLSYLLYLSRFSEILMSLYLKSAVSLCKMTGTGICFLLHPTDLIGGDQIPEMAFFPGMDINANRKMELLEKVLKILSKHFNLVNMNIHAQSVLKNKKIKYVDL